MVSTDQSVDAFPAAVVTGRYVFYNDSEFDGNNPLCNAADEAAIAPDKVALLPGDVQSFANFTSYSRGINGIMVDISGLPEQAARLISAEDFELRSGNSADPTSWSAPHDQPAVNVRLDDADGRVRVTMAWAAGGVRNSWLQVTVKASEHTGLSSPDVFFFGNLVGKTGSGGDVVKVNSRDLSVIRFELLRKSGVAGRYDFDRTGVVTARDLALARRNFGRRLYNAAPFAGAGMGLTGTYFENQDFTGPWVERVDPTVDFSWESDAPVSGVNPYSYSVRWAGQVRPAHSEEYTFYTTSNDGVRLWVDGQLLIDHWDNHQATEDRGQTLLEGGRRIDVRMEYYQGVGTAEVKLEWASASQPRQVIPKSRLYPTRPSPDPPAPYDPTVVGPPSLPGDWRKIFADEFDGPELGPVWRTAQYWDTDHTVVGRGELQAYDATGVSVSDGILHLTARPEERYEGAQYVSGMVQAGGGRHLPSAPTFNFLYGYLEVRAKLPPGQGLLSAIWMMPATYNDANGELDVLEVIGSDTSRANFVLHRNGSASGREWLGADLSEEFHTFAIHWQPDCVTWYVDGVARATIIDPELICPEAMYPIITLAVGGDWPGAPDATTAFPATMDVDYLRVWQR